MTWRPLSPAHTEAVDLHAPAGEYGYDVQFILQGDHLDIDASAPRS